MTSSPRLVRAAAAATTVGVLLSGCGGSAGPAVPPGPAPVRRHVDGVGLEAPPADRRGPRRRSPHGSKASPSATVTRVLAQNINVPWGIAFLPNGNALVSSRDTGRILRVSASGVKKRIGTVPGVVSNGSSGGEAGLLGLALSPNFSSNHWLYAYMSTRSDNRVVRMHYRNGSLGKPHVVLKGIPHGLHHNGGRIAFGPDRSALRHDWRERRRRLAQRKSSLGGKILRMTATGHVPSGNPFPARWSTATATATSRVSPGTRPAGCGPRSSATRAGTSSTSSCPGTTTAGPRPRAARATPATPAPRRSGTPTTPAPRASRSSTTSPGSAGSPGTGCGACG